MHFCQQVEAAYAIESDSDEDQEDDSDEDDPRDDSQRWWPQKFFRRGDLRSESLALLR